jgi:hypothetical protein
MTVTSSPLQSSDHRAHLNESPADSSPYIIDFFAGRDRLLAEIDQATRRRPVELFDPLEDWLSSLISAAALVSVIIAILSMAESRTPDRRLPAQQLISHTESFYNDAKSR